MYTVYNIPTLQWLLSHTRDFNRSAGMYHFIEII